MSKKTFLIVIMTLFMVAFVPKNVSADTTYYVCYTKSGDMITSSSRDATYSDPYYFYSSDGVYSKMSYTKKGKYDLSGPVPMTDSSYVLYKKVNKNGKCSDKYTGDGKIQTVFTYDEYKDLQGTVINKKNKFNMTKYKELKEGSKYEMQLKNAYKTVPSDSADAETIDKYVKSDLRYNDGKGLKKVSKETLKKWTQTLAYERSIDAVMRKAYEASYNYLEAYRLDDTDNVDDFKDKLSEVTEDTLEGNKKAEKAAKLYICVTETFVINPRSMSYSEVYYKYSSDKYSDGNYMSPKTNKRTKSKYALFKNKITEDIEGVEVKNVCSDRYSSKDYSYSEYASLVNQYSIKDNIVTIEQVDNFKYDKTGASNSSSSSSSSSGSASTYKQCPEDEWWQCAWWFLDKGERSEYQFGEGTGASTALDELKELIFDVGNVIFILVTAFLGVKYIWGGVESKFSVKNSLVTLVVAAIVFYGWDAVANILNVKDLLTGSYSLRGHESMINVIYNTVMYIINIAAVGGIIYIGIKYMMAGAEGKSELKLKGIPVVMGVIMVYGTINLINFILKIVEGL